MKMILIFNGHDPVTLDAGPFFQGFHYGQLSERRSPLYDRQGFYLSPYELAKFVADDTPPGAGTAFLLGQAIGALYPREAHEDVIKLEHRGEDFMFTIGLVPTPEGDGSFISIDFTGSRGRAAAS